MLTLQIKEKEIENLTPEEEFVRGTVGAICRVEFDEFWQDYDKWVVFNRNGYEPMKVMVDNLINEVEIPHTILAQSGEFQVGVFGTTETETLPTLYSDYIKIRYGTDTNATTPPTYTPNEIDQLRNSKQDKLTAGDGITIDENNVISATGGGGSGGTTDYKLLENKPQINGVELLGNKSLTDLGIDIPAKTSELENDSGFIDDTAFENYYTKAEVDEKMVVDQTYDKNSQNAQSGKAVAEAVEPKLDKPENAPQVGDTLRVTSVNTDGTFGCEWAEVASGSESFGKFIGSIELEENARIVEFTQCRDGSPLNFSEVIITIKGSSDEGSRNICFDVNHTYGANAYNWTLTTDAQLGTETRYVTVHAKIIGGWMLLGTTQSANIYNTSVNNGHHYISAAAGNNEKITESIVIGIGWGYMTAGTIIKVWGR